MKPTTVTVIVVGHNSGETLERALRSVYGGVDDGFELVLVDNASTDDSVALVRERFPRCRVIESGQNVGFGRACNLGAKETTGEYILLLNPDAWVEPTCVQRLTRVMAADARLGWAAPRLFYPDGRRQFIWGPTISIFGEAIQRLRNRFEGRRWTYDFLPRVVQALGDPGWYSAACALIRRQAWEEVDGFDPGFFLYFEDADLGMRMRRAGWRLGQIAEARAYHDRHRPSATSNRLMHYRASQLRYYRKHRPRWETQVLLRKHLRGLSSVADDAMRAKLQAVYGQAREAFDAAVVDLPVTAGRAAPTSPPVSSPTPASRS